MVRPGGSFTRQSGLYLEPRDRAERETVEQREARLATLSLSEQNAALRQEVRAVREQVRRLTDTLAAVRMEADLYKARLDQGALEQWDEPAAALEGELRVLDVNPELRMVILDGGARRGVRPGLRLAVLRGDRAVARLAVVDVRPLLAGAIIEDTRPGLMPEAGDRVVPARTGLSVR